MQLLPEDTEKSVSQCCDSSVKQHNTTHTNLNITTRSQQLDLDFTLQIYQHYCLMGSSHVIYNNSSDQAIVSKLATLLQQVWCSQKA